MGIGTCCTHPCVCNRIWCQCSFGVRKTQYGSSKLSCDGFLPFSVEMGGGSMW